MSARYKALFIGAAIGVVLFTLQQYEWRAETDARVVVIKMQTRAITHNKK